MLHHQFNYATPLSHFLSLHQSLQHQAQSQLVTNENSSSSNLSPNSPTCDEIASLEPRFHTKEMTAGVVNSSKSFTIAAILGLRQHDRNTDIDDNSSTDLSAVMNLSMHAAGNSNNPSRISASELGRLSHPAFAGHTGSSLTGSVSVTPALHHHHQQHNQSQHQQFNTTPTALAANVPTGSVPNGNVNASQRTTDRSNLKQIPGLAGGGNSSNVTGSSCKKSSSKSKRVRTIFTPEQLERLEAEFERQQYMVGPERLYLAHTLQLTEAQVKVWFQNRRIKWRKHHLELTHQRLAAIKQQQQQLQQQLLHEVDTVADSSSSSCEAIGGGGGPDDT